MYNPLPLASAISNTERREVGSREGQKHGAADLCQKQQDNRLDEGPTQTMQQQNGMAFLVKTIQTVNFAFKKQMKKKSASAKVSKPLIIRL